MFNNHKTTKMLLDYLKHSESASRWVISVPRAHQKHELSRESELRANINAIDEKVNALLAKRAQLEIELLMMPNK